MKIKILKRGDRMAIFQTNYFSESLQRFVDFTIINPSDTPKAFTEGNVNYNREPKLLFLLHGYSGHYYDWLIDGHARDLASKYNLVTVMASAENSFYLNQKGTGAKYTDFFGFELPSFVQSTFHLSPSPENTFTAGYSMGGFGALYLCLSHSDIFGGCLALSSALIIDQVAAMKPEQPLNPQMADYDYYVRVFGDPKKLQNSEKDPRYWISQMIGHGKPLPKIYMACGTEDFLLKENRSMDEFLKSKKVPHIYHEEPGSHNWEFWNKTIAPGIEYLLR
jgi:putative tributyrin esterase